MAGSVTGLSQEYGLRAQGLMLPPASFVMLSKSPPHSELQLPVPYHEGTLCLRDVKSATVWGGGSWRDGPWQSRMRLGFLWPS